MRGALALEISSRDLREELDARLRLIPPHDTVRGLLLNSVEQVVQQSGDAGLQTRFQEAVSGESFVPFFHYPASTLARLLYLVADGLAEKKGGFSDALYFLGGEMSHHFVGSATGKTLRFLSGGNWKRLLSSLPSAYAATIHHGQCRVEWPDSQRGRLLFTDCALPALYLEGTMQKTFNITLGPGTTVIGREQGLLECELVVTWP